MPKEPSVVIKTCEKIIVFCMYGLVAAMPVFFGPWSSDAIDFNKQAILVAVVVVALFAWMLKTLLSGSVTITLSKVHLAVLGLVVVAGLSTIFSVFRYSSFWGWPQSSAESVLSLICFALLYFLVVNNIGEKELHISFKILSVSLLVAQLYGVLQLLGLYVIPFAFAKSNVFNTVGSAGSLGLIGAVSLPLFIIGAIMYKKWWKAVFIADMVLAFAALLLVNYAFLWYVVLAASIILLFFWVMRRDVFDGRWAFLPMFLLVVSLFFILFSPNIKWIPQKSVEVSLSQKASLAVDASALKKNALLGSGPGTFVYDFAKYRSADFNKNALWNFNFNSASSAVLTAVATLGILGLLAWLCVLLMPLFYGARALIFDRLRQDPVKTSLTVALFAALGAQTVAMFLYNFNMSLDFLYFFTLASVMVVLFGAKHTATINLKSSSVWTLVVTFAFTAILIFGLGFLMLEGQRYIADAYYYHGVAVFTGGDKKQGIDYMKIAASNNANLDFYFNQLSVSSLSLLQDVAAAINPANPTQQQTNTINGLVTDSLNAANAAIALNANNVENWSTKAYVCQNLIGVSPDALSCSLDSYDKALALNPTNPYLLLQQGNSNLIAVNSDKNQSGNKDQLLASAKDKYNQAITLKQDYAAAYLQLALVARAQQDATAMAQALQNADQYAGQDATTLLQIGLTYYQAKAFDKAQAEFQKAIAVSPNYANALYYSSITYSQQGQKDNAIAQMQKVLALNPDNQNVKKILDNLNNGRPALDGIAPQLPAPDTQAAQPKK